MAEWFRAEDKLMEAMVKHAIAQQTRGYLDPRDAGSAYDCTVLVPRTYELQYDKKSQETGNLYFETRNTRQQRPAGLTATRADCWAYYLPSQRCIALFAPGLMLAFLEAQLEANTPGVRQTLPHGGDQNSQGIVAPIALILAQPFVEQCPFHVELPVLLPDLSGVGFFCPGCQRLRVVETFEAGRCQTCRLEQAS